MLGRGFMSWPFFLPLVTNVVEGVFLEVRVQDPADAPD
jgi:hypothetical protein